MSKRFGNLIALDNISLSIDEGEILGVLGENGSGKSTLAKILYGMYAPDTGYLVLYQDGKPKQVFLTSPRDAIKHGVIMISQRPQLIDEISIAENVALFLGISLSLARKNLETVLDKFGIQLNIDRVVKSLGYTEKQFVELIKALSYRPKLIIVDEATTYLPKDFKEKFYNILKMFRSFGGSIIFITHKISEALEICDKIAVLRKGKLVNVYDKSISIDIIRKAMFNELDYKEYQQAKERVYHREQKPILKVENIVVLDDYGEKAVDSVSISVARGQLLAIVGATGNGQKELCEGIIGIRRLVSGKIVLDGEDITKLGTAERVLKGIHYIPEDPFKDGTAIDLTVAENIKLFSLEKIDDKVMRKVLDELRVVPPNPMFKVYKLSGGNVQKISISRLMVSKPKCVIAYNPTRMLDEVSSRLVKSMLSNLATTGAGVIVVTEDIDEALDIANQVLVISRGKIVESFTIGGPKIREEIVKTMMFYG